MITKKYNFLKKIHLNFFFQVICFAFIWADAEKLISKHMLKFIQCQKDDFSVIPFATEITLLKILWCIYSLKKMN